MEKKNGKNAYQSMIAALVLIIFIQLNVFGQKGQKWDVTGNTLSSGDFFGTTNDFPILIKTNNFNRITISNDGRVLIGENFIDPTTRFQVDGNSIYNGNITVANNSTFKSSLIIQNNLGIGTSTFPTEKLEINGKLKLIVSDQIPADDGTIMFNGDFLGRKNGEWVSLTGAGTSQCEWIKDSYGIYTNAGNVGINTKPQTILHIKGYTDKPGVYDACMRFETPTGDFTAPIVTDLKTKANGNFVINHQNVEVLSLNSISSTLNNQLIINRPNTITPDISITKNGNDYCPCIRLENTFDDGGGSDIGDGIVTTAFDIYNKIGYLQFRENNGDPLMALNSTAIYVYKDQMNSKDLTVMGRLMVSSGPYGTNAVVVDGNILLLNSERKPKVKLSNDGTILAKGNVTIGDLNDGPADLTVIGNIVNTGKHSIGTTSNTEILNIKGNILLESPISHDNGFFRIENVTYDMGHGSYVDKLKISYKDNPVQSIEFGFAVEQTSGMALNLNNVNLNIKNSNFAITDVNGNRNINIQKDGRIYAQKLLLAQLENWPDYVFEDNYNLLSLAELEKYIKANKHLPEMPKSEDIEKNGIDVGAVNTLLVKKVEELTLFLIEQNKQNEAQQKQIENQQKQIEELMQKVNK